MPNHCNNALLVEGPKVELNRFFNSCIREELGESSKRIPSEFYIDFNRLVPLAEDATNSDRSDLWGTKWNSYSCNQLFLPRSLGDNRVLFTFDTAWSPPLRTFFNGSRLYPNLVFTMLSFEQSNGFASIYQIKNNEFIYKNVDSPEMVELCNNVMGPVDPNEGIGLGNDRIKEKVMPQLNKMPIEIKNIILLMLFVNKSGTDNYEATIPPTPLNLIGE